MDDVKAVFNIVLKQNLDECVSGYINYLSENILDTTS